MQHIDDIRQKYFMECKKIISDLLYTENAEDLAANKFMIDKLNEKVSFLKVLNETPDLVHQQMPVSDGNEPFKADAENMEDSLLESDEKQTFTEENFQFEFAAHELESEISVEEEVVIAVEENVTEADLNGQQTLDSESLNIENGSNEEEIIAEELVSEELIEEAAISEEAYQRTAEHTETEAEELRKIHDIEKSASTETKQDYFEESADHQHQKTEKKFKLPHIKGLKSIESLFDDDPMEHAETDFQSILKSNVPVDFMEAEKPRQEFKLDLNDRIAFSKMLFGGSQTDLNRAVAALNSFKTLDEAKEYLSDIYYQKNWKKVDEYAQRLWHLVENKFH